MWDLLPLQVFQAVAEIGGDCLARRLRGWPVWLRATCWLLWLAAALAITAALIFVWFVIRAILLALNV